MGFTIDMTSGEILDHSSSNSGCSNSEDVVSSVEQMDVYAPVPRIQEYVTENTEKTIPESILHTDLDQLFEQM